MALKKETGVLTKGDLLVERYLIEERVGSGGYGTVFRARDQKENRAVAIKALRADLADDPDYRRRFRREADIARMLISEHVVRVLDSGHSKVRDEEIEFQVLEFVEGGTLQERLRGGPIPLRKALYIAAQIAEALEEAELRGIVHHDVKPKNIFVGKGEHARLGDFGIARATDYPSLKSDDPILGTPRYMSPEQALGSIEGTDARSDIYSLGVVLYEMIAGKPPFEGDSPNVIAYKHANEQAKPLKSLSKNASDAVEQLLQRCLAKRPEERYRTAGEMREAVWSVIDGVTATGDTPITPLGAAPGRLPFGLRVRRMLRVPQLRRALRTARGSRLAVVSAAPLAAAIAVGVVIAIGSDGGGDRRGTAGTHTPTLGPTATSTLRLGLLTEPTQKSCSGDSFPAALADENFQILGPKGGEIVPSRPTFCWSIANTNRPNCLYTIEISTAPLKDGNFPWWYQWLVDPVRGAGRESANTWKITWSGAEGAKGTEAPPFDVAPQALAPGVYYWRGRGCADHPVYSAVQTFRVEDPWQDALTAELDKWKAENRYLTQIKPIRAGDTEYATVVYRQYLPRDEFYSLYPGSFQLVTASLISGRNGEGPGPSQDTIAIYRRTSDGPVVMVQKRELGIADLGRFGEPSDLNGDGNPELVVSVAKYSFDFPGYSSSMLIYGLSPNGVTPLEIRLPARGVVFSSNSEIDPSLADDVAAGLVLQGFEIDGIRDLDGDGTLEIVLVDNSWQFYRPLVDSSWPQGQIVLSWDGESKAFVDQSPKFALYFDSRIETLERALSSPSYGGCDGDRKLIDHSISLLLEFGRSGRASAGWFQFERARQSTTDYWKSLLPSIEESLALAVPRDGSSPAATTITGALSTSTCEESVTPTPPLCLPPVETGIAFTGVTTADDNPLEYYFVVQPALQPSPQCSIGWSSHWVFGDGEIHQQNGGPGFADNHLYSSPGRYTVTVTVGNPSGACHVTQTIDVVGPSASPTPTPSGAATATPAPTPYPTASPTNIPPCS